MARWFWYFLIYSFLGFVLEVLFARAIHNPKRDRKCRYFLPICPVYGLGMVLILALPEAVVNQPFLLLICGAGLATAAEYAAGLFYEKAAGVCFWDYSHLPLHLGGRVCLLFSTAWGVLSMAAVYHIQPAVAALTDRIPDAWAVPALLFFLLDTGMTLYILRRTHQTEALRWYLPADRRARRQE